MVKYRRLSNEELIALKDDFVKFLSSQSISAPDWEKLKQSKIEKVDELIDFFSDIVMEKVLSKIEYLEVLSENEIKLFHMQESKAKLIGIKFKREGLDLNKADQFEIIFNDISKLLSFKPEIYSLEKDYTKTRAEEAFFLISIGATLSNKTFFEQINAFHQA